MKLHEALDAKSTWRPREDPKLAILFSPNCFFPKKKPLDIHKYLIITYKNYDPSALSRFSFFGMGVRWGKGWIAIWYTTTNAWLTGIKQPQTFVSEERSKRFEGSMECQGANHVGKNIVNINQQTIPHMDRWYKI